MATVYNVLDVSTFNAIQDYNKASAEIDGVIIRAGYRGYGSSGSLVKDNKFDTHYNGFVNKTKIGVYFFTQAMNRAEGIAEANYVYSLIKDKQIDFPVYIDSEYSNSNHNGRADSLSAAQRTEAIMGFCDRMIELGYRTGIYASDSWYVSNLNYNNIKDKDYSIWVASYSYAPKRVTVYDGWQYSSSESVTGSTGRFDKSYFYNDVAGWETSEKRNIADATITLDLYVATYYGGPNNPAPTVVYDGTTLKLGQHYSITYGPNTNAGEGTVTINGIGGIYTGSKTVKFTIESRDLSLGINVNSKLPDSDNCIDLSSINLTFMDMTLVEGTDYTKSISESTNSEYKIATVTFTGKGNYSGTISREYNIEKIKISISGFNVTNTTKFVYTGSEIKPGVILKDTSDNTLSPNTDYNLSYSNNINVGTAVITITGKGNYKGTLTSNFIIEAKDIKDCTMSCGTADAQGCYHLNNLLIKYNTITLVKDTDYSYTTISETINNRVTSIVTAVGKGNYKGTLTGSYLTEIIDPRIDVSTLSISLKSNSFTFTGSEIIPEVNIPSGMVKDTDYTITCSNNINAGTGTLVINGIGDNYKGTKTLTFAINKVNLSNCTITCGNPNSEGFYDISNFTVKYGNILLVRDTNYTYSISTTEVDKCYQANITVTGKGNYTGSVTKSYKTGVVPPTPKHINSLEITGVASSYEYNGIAITPVVTIIDSEEGYELILNHDYSVEYSDNINAGTGHITITGLISTYYGTKTIDFTINKIDISSGSLSCGAPDDNGYYDINNVTLSANSKILRLNTDYTITTQEIESGKYINTRITATGIKNYFGTISNDFRTNKVVKDINTVNIQLNATSFIYTGSNIVPNIVTSLKLNEDYIVIYPEESIVKGIYSIQIVGMGIYENSSKIIEYTIEPCNINHSSISILFDEPDALGCQSLGSMRLIRNNTELQSFVDYKFTTNEYEIEDGYTKSDITIIGINNYTGTNNISILISKKEYYKGKKVILDKIKVYVRYNSKEYSIKKSGEFYLWDSNIVNNRVRVTNNIDYIGRPGFITGWIDLEDLIDKNSIRIGDIVRVNGNLNVYANGTGNSIARNGVNMVVVDIIDKKQFEYPYGLATAPNRIRIGWAKESEIEKLNVEEEDE